MAKIRTHKKLSDIISSIKNQNRGNEMKLHETSKKRFLKYLTSSMIAVTAMTPMQALAYTTDQVGKLDNQVKVESTLNFNENQKVPVTLNGLPVNMKTPAYVTGGRTLLPVRGVAELLSAQVNFQPNGEKGLVQITKDANEVLLQIGRNKMMTNGNMSQIDPANAKIGAATFKGTTYLPLRAVADALGVQVAYENGRVNIITTAGEVVVPPVSGQNLVPNTNPELITEFMDANSPKIEGDMWIVPEGLIYKNPAGLEPGDKLTMEQKKSMMPEIVKRYDSMDKLSKRDWVYIPVGARVCSGADLKGWVYTDMSYQGALGYGFRTYKDEVFSPKSAFSGTVVHKDGTNSTFSAGSGQEIRKKGGMANVKYIIYASSENTRNNRSYVTFYN